MARRCKYYDVFVFVPGREWLHNRVYELSLEDAQNTATEMANKYPGWSQVRVYPTPLAQATPNRLVWD